MSVTGVLWDGQRDVDVTSSWTGTQISGSILLISVNSNGWILATSFCVSQVAAEYWVGTNGGRGWS